MKRYLILAATFAIALLIFGGCENESVTTMQKPSVAPPAQSQPAEVKPPYGSKPAETTSEQALPQASAKPEPNMQPVAAPEPNTQQAVAQEPNVQKIEDVKPAPAQPAESNVIEQKNLQTANSLAIDLCKSCSEILDRYVDRQGMVDYRSLSRRKPDLLIILDKFKTLDRNEYNTWSKDDKLAFWLNVYNLEFLRIILDNYPIESSRMLRLFWPPNSIRHIKGIWDEHKFIVMNEEFTLQEVEKRIFEKEFDDPRVFFAISYGTISGPPLRNEAYCGSNLQMQLDDQVKKFLAGKDAFKIDRANKVVYLSSILNSTWHGQGFVTKYSTDLKFKQQSPEIRAVLNFLTKYLQTADIDFLETGNYTIDYLRYDWTLNERPG